MIIAIAGPYSAPTPLLRRKNLDALNKAAASVLLMGHVPLVGVNAALPVIRKAKPVIAYECIMKISMALVSVCDGLLLIGESPGANSERDHFLSLGKPVFYSLDALRHYSEKGEDT
ncbi:MAG TPA: DUF4406 domain-containing protein [Bacteroidia bacterium]|nr:DUF4406 domain-containing protein [Bacteroidia bacterium]